MPAHSFDDNLDPAIFGDLDLIVVDISKVAQRPEGLCLNFRAVRMPAHSLEDSLDAAIFGDLDLIVVGIGEFTQRPASLLWH